MVADCDDISANSAVSKIQLCYVMLIIAVCTPLGFARIFTVMGNLIFKPKVSPSLSATSHIYGDLAALIFLNTFCDVLSLFFNNIDNT